ncbi:MAG: DoxX family protein [Muribaculaceae bacterium]|nr:DoxX family protein [Muribaculaceae bacterium]
MIPRIKTGLFGTGRHPKLRIAAVWTLRILIGALFVTSGFAKTIDIWGFIYKIEEYLNVWGFQQPRSLVLTAATLMSSAEMVLGLMLMIGCYRRAAVWLLLAMMAGLLPLSAYIWIMNPVSDCGCFGDMLVISNSATFWKNIVITIGLCYLALTNEKVAGLFHAYSQWILAVSASIYAVILSLIGYTVQPMIDFRSFPIGRQLSVDDAEDESEPDEVFEFIYEKDGHTETFTEDCLPDSTWTFVDRKLISGTSPTDRTDLIVYDESGQDVTPEAIAAEGEQILIVVPQGDRADVSFTYMINELQRFIEARGGSLIELASFPDSEGLEYWKDLSMASFPIYSAESTVLKELSRGAMSAVLVKDGRIAWKRTLGSIDIDMLDGENADILMSAPVNPPLKTWLRNLTVCLAGLYIFVFIIDRSALLLKWRERRARKAAAKMGQTEKKE